MLDFEFVADNRWDPIFYLLQELRINQKYLEQTRKNDCLLHLIDYFVDYNPNKPDQNPKFFLVYEDFHSNLRDIMEFRRANKQQYPETNLMRILLDMSNAVHSLHKIGLAHRNIRPENIFFNHNTNSFKLGGLGLAYPAEDPYLETRDLVGAPFYLPVDLFTHMKLRDNKLVFGLDVFKADIYAIGMIMCELITLQLDTMDMIAIKGLYQMSKVEKVANIIDFIRLCEDKVKTHYTMLYVIDEAVSEGILSDRFGRLVKSMIDSDYLRRLDIIQVRNIVNEIIDPTSNKLPVNFIFSMSEKNAYTTEKTEKNSQNLTGNMSKLANQFKDQSNYRNRTGSGGSNDSHLSAAMSEVNVKQRFKTIIFSRKNKKSAHLPVKNDITISKELHSVSLVDCQKLKIEQSLIKNEFELFEILTIAIFLSTVNLSEEADNIFQEVQTFYEGRHVADLALMVTLMLSRIKNMSKMRSTKGLATLITNLEAFCVDKHMMNDFLCLDLYGIKARVHYCTNHFDQAFSLLAQSIDICDRLEEGRETYLNLFLLVVVKMLCNFKKYSDAYKILLLQNTKKKVKACRATDVVTHDVFWLERECLMVKLLFKLQRYSKAASYFEYVLSHHIKDQKEQILVNYAGLTVELFGYAVLTYLRLENLNRALQIYNDLFGALEYQQDEQKMFYGIAACLKGVILINRDLNLKLVSRYASLANRMSKNVNLEANETCNILMFKIMIKLYLALGKHSEVESVASSCIKVIERSYCPYHLQTIDFYVYKVESLLARQKYTEAQQILAQMSAHFDPLEKYQSDKQIMDLMGINFSVMMDLGMLDPLEDYLAQRKEKVFNFQVTSPKLECMALLIDKAEEIIGRGEHLIIDEELNSNRTGHPTIAHKKYSMKMDAFLIKYQLKKRDYTAAVDAVKVLMEDQESMTKFVDDFDLLITCSKVMVKGAKYQIGGFSEACQIMNELIDHVNATSNFTEKVRGIHEVSMYLFYTGEHQKALEYLFQAMCFLEAKVVAEQISTCWEVLSLKIKSLSLISKFSDSTNANNVNKNLVEYVQTSLRVVLDEFNDLDVRSKSFDSRKRIKNLLLLSRAFSRCNEAEIAYDLIDSCRTKIVEVNNGEFCYLKLSIQKSYAKILITMGTYEDAIEQTTLALNKAVALSDRANNKFIRTKLLALLKDIYEKGNFDLEKAPFDDSEVEESEPMVWEEPA